MLSVVTSYVDSEAKIVVLAFWKEDSKYWIDANLEFCPLWHRYGQEGSNTE